MEEAEPAEENIIPDDCGDGRDGLTADEVLREEFGKLVEEIEKFINSQRGEYFEPEEPKIKLEEFPDDEYEPLASSSSKNQPVNIKRDLDEPLNDVHDSEPTASTSPPSTGRIHAEVKPGQRKEAEELLQKIRRSQPHIEAGKFQYVDMFIITPAFVSLGRQTLDRFQSFINQKQETDASFLQDLRSQESSGSVDDRVLRNVAGEKENEKFSSLKRRIIDEPKTLFYVVHDEAHYNMKWSSRVADLINDRQLAGATNLILLQVTATPYSLVTANSRIRKDNRRDMAKENSNCNYFGINDYIKTT